MNMKKTIAAIAAGAVAVSAMATTVSALEAKTLTYNLVKTTKNQDAKGTITATFTNVPLQAGGTLVVDPIAGNAWNTIVTIGGSFWDDVAGANKSFDTVTATKMDWETGYSIEGSKLWDDATNTVRVPIVQQAGGVGTAVGLRSTTNAVIRVTVKYSDLPDSVGYAGALNGLIKEGKRGIKITSIGDPDAGLAPVDCTATFTNNADNATQVVRIVNQAELNKLSGMQLTYTNTPGAGGAVGTNAWVNNNSNTRFDVTAASGVTFNGIRVTDSDLLRKNVTITPIDENDGSNYSSWLAGTGQDWFNGTHTLTESTKTDAVTGRHVWYDEAWHAYDVQPNTGYVIGGAGANTITFTYVAGDIAGAQDVTSIVNAALVFLQPVNVGDTLDISVYMPAQAGFSAEGILYASDIAGAAVETSGNSETKRPYHSSLTNKTVTNFNQGWYDGTQTAIFGGVGSGNVITWAGYVSDDNVTWQTEDHQMVSNAVMAVINDAVQNYNDVVFTFNTATQNVKITRNNKGEITDYEYTNDGVEGRKVDGDKTTEIVNYTAFGRHYWDKDNGYDPTVYITNDWLGNNLFEGALIINNNLTLSLGATDKFDWTATSLSFSWDAIQDAALTQNQYANYIQTMVLRTSTDWFWDNMTVSLGETETEELDSGAPAVADEEDLPEDEEDDLGIVEDEEEEEEEEETDVEPEPEVAPVETATNPGTGNAPVALAVIPVALAAAAVVAKKRG